MFEQFGVPTWFLVLIIVLVIWDMIWKGIGLWKAGRNNHMVWFVCILVFNTIGILPILYISFFQPKKSGKRVARSRRNRKKK